MEDLLRSLWAVLGGIFRSCPVTSQKLPLCGNHQTQRILGPLLRSLLRNPRNFSEVAPEVHPAVHTAALRLRVSGSKIPHLSSAWKREFSVKKSPLFLQGNTGKWGFFDRKLPFPGREEMGDFWTPKPSFPGNRDSGHCLGSGSINKTGKLNLRTSTGWRAMCQSVSAPPPWSIFRADFWEGDATKHFPVKKGVFSEKGVGKDFYRKGNSVKRFGPFIEPPDSEKLLSSSPARKSALTYDWKGKNLGHSRMPHSGEEGFVYIPLSSEFGAFFPRKKEKFSS